MKDLTVLSPQIDPFRLDTPANHKIGKWLADTAATLGLGDRKIHLRGLHYMVIGRPKPDGSAYTNTEADWLWLSGEAGKAARWLGLHPVRSDLRQPQRRAGRADLRASRSRSRTSTSASTSTSPTPTTSSRSVGVDDFNGVQPYKIVMVGEKSSLDDGARPDRGQLRG